MGRKKGALFEISAASARYPGLAPDSFTTFAHFAMSSMRNFSRSFALANRGHDTRGLQAYLGHRYIQHTVRYTELSSDRFKGWWKD